ncbi:hypothetical protein K504DRAFT_470184 [Pleomassaria siparia CBS 279.74]|uniref:DUF3176 domain containing protein n=1 Tax=Pleomassaria siparia CBS 279.74 TaxID=1314801 RepID=A0A6G1K636_9PLEO|nr:hypothetical protein K504DRAFT_470184 [Pleomassaria siparia CBS 279.74]
MKSSHERNESTQNIAQRIEKRLWQYSSSGNVVKRWLLEIISWIISALCMGTIIGILLYYQNDKLPRIPGGLTLNAIIAVLSKVASAALLLPASEALGQLKWSWFQGDSKKMWDFEIFDNASRGPWGSFLLLIRTKGKTLAALGAAVTLLSLALDPFFQQVVTFPDRWTLQGRSSITIATHYSPNVGKQLVAGKRIIPQDADFTAVATKFFYDNGTESVPFGNGTRADIPLSCPTSNCTWPAYETLGVCSACEDVSQLLTFSCLTTRLEWIANLTGPGANVIYPNGTVCGYFFNATSAKPMLMSGYRVDTNDSTGGEALLMRALPLITNPSRLPLFGGSINFKHVRNPIADFVIASAADGSASVYRNETPVAHECVLSWCVKTIRSSYYWANYNEDVIEKFINNTAGPYPWVPVKSGSTIDIFYPQNITIDAPSNNHNTSNNTREDYGVGNTTAFAAIGVFDEFFPSFLTAANASAEPFLRYRIQQNLLPKSRDLTNNPWRASNNITQHMERLATALTNVVRSSSGKTQVLGTAFSMETYVEVRWEWLALPLAVLLLSLVFLASTVMKSSREKDRVGVWKTSALATLLYGLPDDMQKKITSSTAVGTPRAKAKELKIKMLPKFGWRISGNIFSPMPPKVKPNPPPPGWI